jgi:hypothetical protein
MDFPKKNIDIQFYLIICLTLSLLAATIAFTIKCNKENVEEIHKNIEKKTSDSRFKINYFGRQDRFIVIIDTKYNREYIGFNSSNSALTELNLIIKE